MTVNPDPAAACGRNPPIKTTVKVVGDRCVVEFDRYFARLLHGDGQLLDVQQVVFSGDPKRPDLGLSRVEQALMPRMGSVGCKSF